MTESDKDHRPQDEPSDVREKKPGATADEAGPVPSSEREKGTVPDPSL